MSEPRPRTTLVDRARRATTHRLARGPAWVRVARGGRDDAGSVLVLVLVVAVLLVGATTVALTTSASSSGQTGAYGNTTTARLDAESGFQAALLQIKNATSWQGLPSCSPVTTDMAYGSYTVSVAYTDGGGTSLCPLGGSLPTTATGVVTSTGQYGGQSAEIQGNLTLSSQPQPLPAFDYTIYSPQDVSFDSQAAIDAGSTTALPNIYTGAAFSCTTNTVIQGSVEAYQTSGDIDADCTINGTLYVETGPVTVTSTASVGALEMFGGSLSMSSSGTIAGNAYVSGGNVSFSNSTATVGGNLGTTGSLSYSWDAVNVKGTACSSSPSCIPVGVTMPSAPPFPQVTDPHDSGWPAGTEYIPVSSSSCNGFFANKTHPNTSPSTFNLDVNASTAPVTVVDAPSCAVDLPATCPAVGSSTYTLNTDLVMFVQSFTDYGCNIFQSASGSHHNIAVVVPYGDGTGLIEGDNTTDYTSSVNVLFYTPGQVKFVCSGTVTGQIIAGGGVYGTDTFTMTASNDAASIIPTAVQSGAVQVTQNSENLIKD